VAAKSNILELNGKRYDAVTGTFLGAAAPSAGASQIRQARHQSVDGFVAKPSVASSQVAVPAKAAAATHHAIRKAQLQLSDVKRAPSQQLRHHQPSGSKTLMRHAVQKPAPSLKRHTKVQHPSDVLVKQPTISVAPKLSSYQIDQKRVRHAQQTPRHDQVRRYAVNRNALAPRAAATAQAPAVSQPAVRPVHADAAAQTLRQPQTPVAHSTDIFEQALARANTHIEQPLTDRQIRRRSRRRAHRALSITATALAVALLVGFFGWQQRSALTMRYAASKSGIAAHLPAAKPGGFSVGNISYNPGLVATEFINHKTGESFAVVQKQTNWDSNALRDDFVASKSRTYQTIDAAGRTLYTYGDNDATWVDNGIWYQVNTKGSLTTNQLVALALSM
jgi:hypothetical protein